MSAEMLNSSSQCLQEGLQGDESGPLLQYMTGGQDTTEKVFLTVYDKESFPSLKTVR